MSSGYRSPARLATLLWVISAAGMLISAGCAEPGGVRLLFEVPDDSALSPLSGDRLAEVTLVAWDENQARSSEARVVADSEAGFDLGQLPVDQSFTLGVELRAANGRLIGFGQNPSPVRIQPEQIIEVPISVRRPYVYVPGGGVDVIGPLPPTLASFDSSLDPSGSDGPGPGESYRTTIEAPMLTTAIAPTADGRELVVVGSSGDAGMLTLLATSSNQSSSAEIPIAANPVDVSVSADGVFAVVGHSGPEGGVTVVNLEKLRAGDQGTGLFAALGNVGAVVAASTPGAETPRAFALVDRAPGRVDLQSEDPAALLQYRADRVGCTGAASTIAVLALAEPMELGISHQYGGPIHDLVASPSGDILVLADACNDIVVRMDPTSGETNKLTELTDATTLALQDGRLYAAGSLPSTAASGATIQIVNYALDGSGESRFELPAQEEHAAAIDLSSPGQSLEVSIEADVAFAFDLAVSPAGDHIALLTEAYHNAINIDVLFPAMEIDTYEYLLIDASSGAITHRFRAYCLVKQLSGTVFNWLCTDSPGQDAIVDANEMYIPFHLSMLYGAR